MLATIEKYRKLISAIAASMVLFFIVLCALLSLLRPDLSFRSNQISDFLVGPYAGVAIIAFVCLAAASMLLALVTYHTNKRLARVLFIYSLAVLAAGLTVPTTIIHSIAALTAFVSIPIAVSFSRENLTFRVTWIFFIIISFALWPIGIGSGERVTVLLELLWLLQLALKEYPTK